MNKKLIYPGSFIVITISIIFILLILKTPSTEITGNIYVSSLSLKNHSSFSFLNNVKCSYVALENISKLSSNRMNRFNSDESSFWISGSEIKIKDLFVEKAASISFEKIKRQFHFISVGSLVNGKIHYKNSKIFYTTYSEQYTHLISDPPESIQFRSNPLKIDNQFRLNFITDSLHIKGLFCTELRFIENNPPFSNYYKSSILKGQLIINETGKIINLNPGDSISFVMDNKASIDIRGSQNSLFVTFKGTFSRFKLFSDVGNSNLKPSLLEFLSSNQTIELIWGSIMYLFLLIWGIWKWISKEKVQKKIL